jgi:hypothetical protein
VSARPIPRKEDRPSDDIRWIPRKPILIPSRSHPICDGKDDGLFGVLGILVVAAILGVGVYSVIKYLL